MATRSHVRVTEKGKANAAVIKSLAKALDVAKSRFEIASGAKGRTKTLRTR